MEGDGGYVGIPHSKTLNLSDTVECRILRNSNVTSQLIQTAWEIKRPIFGLVFVCILRISGSFDGIIGEIQANMNSTLAGNEEGLVAIEIGNYKFVDPTEIDFENTEEISKFIQLL